MTAFHYVTPFCFSGVLSEKDQRQKERQAERGCIVSSSSSHERPCYVGDDIVVKKEEEFRSKRRK